MQQMGSLIVNRSVVAMVAMALLAGCVGAAAPSSAAPVAANAKKKKKKKKKAVPAPYDADGDALPYAWEAKPVVQKKKAKKKKRKKGRKSASAAPNLSALGASPNRKDVFLQLNFASEAVRSSIPCSELDLLHNAFANAPVSNPDGSQGITLHLDAGKSCPSRSYNQGSSPTFAIPGSPACPTVGDLLNFGAQLPESRVGAWRFSAVGDGCGSTHGAAPQPGVSSATFTSGGDFAHVMLHELGHNFGLSHDIAFQPNRFSVMNTRQFVSDDGNGNDGEVPDFQRFPVPALDESNLSELAGVSAPAFYSRHFVLWNCPTPPGGVSNTWMGYGGGIDWDCDAPLAPGPPALEMGAYAQDVNGDGQVTVLPATGNEWVQLDYSGGGRIGKLP